MQDFRNRWTLRAYSTHCTNGKKYINMSLETLPFQVINTLRLQ